MDKRHLEVRILSPQPGSPLSCVRRAGEKQVARISKWWEDFEPNDTVPMPAGSFIRRIAAYTMLQNLTGWPATVLCHAIPLRPIGPQQYPVIRVNLHQPPSELQQDIGERSCRKRKREFVPTMCRPALDAERFKWCRNREYRPRRSGTRFDWVRVPQVRVCDEYRSASAEKASAREALMPYADYYQKQNGQETPRPVREREKSLTL